MSKYNFSLIEKKWQEFWKKYKTFKVADRSDKKKFYILDMFPYPSGDGLHVGHTKGYIATDIFARYKMLNGYNVLHPMGFDSFGLPAENYAIKNKIHPQIAVEKNIKKFKTQLEKFGFTYDWDREIITSDPSYYKWTQWIFLQMFKAGLAYESNEPINWCPSCKTGLANEDLEDGKCERCSTLIEKKPMRQWVLRMTKYADRLLEDLDLVDWEKSIIEQQKNWIGRSEGAEIRFSIVSQNNADDTPTIADNSLHQSSSIYIFTTRPDTIFGATYMVIAPEHKIISNFKNQILNFKEIQNYINISKNKSDIERTELSKDKTGIEIKGIKAINPVNKKELPIFVADYVIPSYGTGAIMAVPAHDERDWEFAKKYNLPIRHVIIPRVVDNANPPQKDKKNTFRNIILAIVYDPKKKKYLCLKWKKQPWITFITGGIQENEDVIDAARREILEETGFLNLNFLRLLGGQFESHFYAAHKGVNRRVHNQVILFELINKEQKEISKTEKEQYDIIWLSEDEILKTDFRHAEFNMFWHRLTTGAEVYLDKGILINSDNFNGKNSETAKREITEFVNGKLTTHYKMRDWVFSRQRYWGEPIPLVFCEHCAVRIKKQGVRIKGFNQGEILNPGWIALDEKELPLILPEVKSYKLTDTGESPLANIIKWTNVKCPKCNKIAKRETNTMPQWAGSCWYYLRYIDPRNRNTMIDPIKEKYWMQPNGVDFYVGGAEHATRHLLYARFWHKFLYDIKAVSTKEPFYKLQHVGLIRGIDGRKMSKRWNNVINPDDVIAQFGADALRLYEMFMGPFSDSIAWEMAGVKGINRFLNKIWEYYNHTFVNKTNSKTNDESINLLNTTINKVSEDIERFSYNTAISQMMILINYLSKNKIQIKKNDFGNFLVVLSPFAPHICEEIWSLLDNNQSIFLESWPKAQKVKSNQLSIPVMINGKKRAVLEINSQKKLSQEEIVKLAMDNLNAAKYLKNQKIKKVIYISGKILSFVI